MPSLPHHLPQPHRNQSPDKRPQRIHHQIRQFEKAHVQEQLETLDCEGQPEAGQGHKAEPTAGADALGDARNSERNRPKGMKQKRFEKISVHPQTLP